MYGAQTSALENMLGQLSSCTFFRYQLAGTSFYTSRSQSPQFDLGGLWGQIEDRSDLNLADNVLSANAFYGSILEGSILQQNLGVTGISTVRFLDEANTAGQRIFTAQLLNWSYVSGS
jgi:hypothetical protein